MSDNMLLFPVSSSSPSTSSVSVDGVNYIEHQVSKYDTLAGVAIKYGVEVADIKRMNNLVTDLQMFALKSLQIPLPGRHPPSSGLVNGSPNGSDTPGQKNARQAPSRRHSDVLELIQSLKLKPPQQEVSPAMSTLQGYYGLRHSSNNGIAETEMTSYRTDRARYFEDELPISSPFSDPFPGLRRNSRSSANGFMPEDGMLDVPAVEAGDKYVRRRQKAENSSPSSTLEKLLKEDTGGSDYSTSSGRRLALRPKSVRNLSGDAESGWLSPVPVSLGDSLIDDGFSGVRKSSSTPSFQNQDKDTNNNSSSIWSTSKWNLRSELQAFSASAIARPIFDGLPKPLTGRRNKAALD